MHQPSMETPTDDDRRQVGAFLQSRSAEDFLALYERHTPALYRFAGRLAGGPGVEADDVVQETWVRAISRLHRFGWRCRLGTWLFAIALNVRRELLRRAGRDRAIAAELDALAPRATPEIDTQRRLHRALVGLADGYREVIVLHDIEGYTHQEIARHFGIREGTSKSQLARGRRALRRALEDGGGGSDAG